MTAPGTFETGDPGLKMERANSLEATLRLRLQEFTFDGSVYATCVRQLHLWRS